MKRNFVASAVALFVMLAVTAAFACEITFDPAAVKADASGKAKVTIWVTWEHKKCVLEDDELTIDYVGMKPLKEGAWTKVKPGVFSREVEVQLTGSEGTITVWRECSKKGRSEGVLKITK